MSDTAKKLAAMTQRPTSFASPYDAGFDAGVNGSNTVNANFRWFGEKWSTLEWSRGNADGLKKRNKVQP